MTDCKVGDMKPSEKMRVLYAANGFMVGIKQKSDGHLYIGDASGQWHKTVPLDDLVPRRNFVEVPQKSSFVKSLISKVVPFRLEHKA